MVRCVRKVKRLMVAEELPFRQWAKERWFEGMDRNTAYFHAVMKGNKRRLKICSLTWGDGSRVVEQNEVAKEVVGFYSKLLSQDDEEYEVVQLQFLQEYEGLDNSRTEQ